MKPTEVAEMHEYLVGFDKYNYDLPIYLENPLSDDEVFQIRSIIEHNRNRDVDYFKLPGDQEEYRGKSKYDPRIMTHISRQVIDFKCPTAIEQKLDSIIKPIYKEDIKLCYYNYIDYNPKYGNGKFAPALPPHIDTAETPLTFNYQIGGNIDWEIFIEDKPYSLKTGDAIIFSSLNQVHWRPKRRWKQGDFVEILTMNWSPLTSWALTGKIDPLDAVMFPDRLKAYSESLSQRPEFQKAWTIYNEMGKEIGIPFDKHGELE